MTHSKSQDSNTEKNENTPKKKKKGIIRFEAIIPALIVFVGIGAYFSIFFDSHLKWAIEHFASHYYGAEVNISSIKSSFKEARLEIKNLQMTNSEEPEYNLLEIGKTSLRLNTDALLKAKFVIEESGIEAIAINSKRNRPGKVYGKKDDSHSLTSKKLDLLKRSQDALAENIFGDILTLLSGEDPIAKLKEDGAQLESERTINELGDSIADKETDWKERIKNLPNSKTLNALKERTNQLKFNTGNPQEFLKDVEEAKKILAEADAETKKISAAKQTISEDMASLQKDLGNIDDAIKSDINFFKKRMKLPTFDKKTISGLLFGEQGLEYFSMLEKFKSASRKGLPLPQEQLDQIKDLEKYKVYLKSEEPSITPKERALGRNIEFPVKNSYPQFHLKKMKINSVASADGKTGQLKGEITNFISNPPLLGKPAIIEFQGEFPKKNIQGLEAKITLDHVNLFEKTETIDAKIHRFPVAEKKLIKSKKVKFGFNKASGSSIIEGRIKGENIHLSVDNTFEEIDYQIDTESKTTKKILTNVADDISIAQVRSVFMGEMKSPNILIETNLATAIIKSFRNQLDDKIKETEAKLKDFVNQKIESRKRKVQAQVNALKSGYEKKLNDIKNQFESSKKEFQAKIDKNKNALESKKKEAEDKAKKQVEDKLKNESKKLFKKLNF